MVDKINHQTTLIKQLKQQRDYSREDYSKEVERSENFKENYNKLQRNFEMLKVDLDKHRVENTKANVQICQLRKALDMLHQENDKNKTCKKQKSKKANAAQKIYLPPLGYKELEKELSRLTHALQTKSDQIDRLKHEIEAKDSKNHKAFLKAARKRANSKATVFSAKASTLPINSARTFASDPSLESELNRILKEDSENLLNIQHNDKKTPVPETPSVTVPPKSSTNNDSLSTNINALSVFSKQTRKSLDLSKGERISVIVEGSTGRETHNMVIRVERKLLTLQNEVISKTRSDNFVKIPLNLECLRVIPDPTVLNALRLEHGNWNIKTAPKERLVLKFSDPDSVEQTTLQIYSNLEKNSIPDNIYSNELYRFEKNSLKINAILPLQLGDVTVLLYGCDSGLHLHRVLDEGPIIKFENITEKIHEIVKSDEFIYVITGKDCRIEIFTIKTISEKMKSDSKVSLHHGISTKQCSLLQVKESNSGLYLSFVSRNTIVKVYKFDEQSSRFIHARSIEMNDQIKCMKFSNSSLLLGTDNFYMVPLNKNQTPSPVLFLEDLGDAWLQSLSSNKFGNLQPLEIFQLSTNNNTEFLLVFKEFGLFVDKLGRNTRRGVLKWECSVDSIVFNDGILYVCSRPNFVMTYNLLQEEISSGRELIFQSTCSFLQNESKTKSNWSCLGPAVVNGAVYFVGEGMEEKDVTIMGIFEKNIFDYIFLSKSFFEKFQVLSS